MAGSVSNIGAVYRDWVAGSDEVVRGRMFPLLAGPLVLCGSYDALTSRIVAGITPGPVNGSVLPTPAWGNRGWFWICTNAGFPAPPAPQGAMNVGDWVVATGKNYIHINFRLPTVGTGLATVETDQISILGDGSAFISDTTGPLHVGTIDCGKF